MKKKYIFADIFNACFFMKEAVFIRQNKEKWKEYEAALQQPQLQSPDVLADLYIDVTNDLSFAQSHYPHSKITTYLNGLSSRLHQFICKEKTQRFSKIVLFWTRDIPDAMFLCRKELLYSFLVFFAGAIIGSFSVVNDETFPRLILGDEYVDMTTENIQKGDPMAVYKSMNEGKMVVFITFNNIKVAFMAFIGGVFTSLATAYVMLSNGVMIGAFLCLFQEHGLLGEALLAVWLHGTLEISAIIVAGAAGIVMGNGWLFPKTYTRIESFRQSAKKGVKIILGTIPAFVVAGFIESFLTRHTDMPDIFRILIIFLSLVFVVWYYVVYPYIINRKK